MRLRVVGLSLVLLVLLTAAPSFAQGMAWGAKGGVNLAKVTIENEDITNRTAGVFGAFFRRDFNPMVGIQPEFLYSMKGGKIDDSGDTADIKFDYFEIPVLLHVGPQAKGAAAPFFVVGPSFGFKTNAEVSGSDQGISVSQDFSDFVNSVDTGFAIGGGVVVKKFLIEFRFTQSFSDIFTDRGHTEQVGPDDGKNRAISIMFGFELPR